MSNLDSFSGSMSDLLSSLDPEASHRLAHLTIAVEAYRAR